MLPVAILDPRDRAGREALIEQITRHERRVDVALLLDDGRRAEACLEPDDLVWLDLSTGDIVGVRLLPVPRECDAPALLLSV
ncbi:MAG TPA: hypothetical protein VNT03_18475 [Baekduia sp.]|nr:hypothetical protein [Baekduia sp.]